MYGAPRALATGEPRFSMDVTTMPGNPTYTRPPTGAGTGTAVTTLQGSPLAPEEKSGMLHVSSNAALST